LADLETRTPEEVARYSSGQRFRRRLYLKARAHLIDAGMQLFGMYGLMHTYRRTLGWAVQLVRGGIRRYDRVPVSRLPMYSPDGGPAVHALPGTPGSEPGGALVSLDANPRQRKVA
jgi:hypothetical protein